MSADAANCTGSTTHTYSNMHVSQGNMWTRKKCSIPHVQLLTLSYTSIKGKPLGLGLGSCVIPWHRAVMEEIKPPCVLLTITHSYWDMPQRLSMAGRRSPVLRAFNVSVLVSDVAGLKGVEELCCGWKHDRHTGWDWESQMGCECLDKPILVRNGSCQGQIWSFSLFFFVDFCLSSSIFRVMTGESPSFTQSNHWGHRTLTETKITGRKGHTINMEPIGHQPQSKITKTTDVIVLL